MDTDQGRLDNTGPRGSTHTRPCNGNIYLTCVPFIFGKTLQAQTILSDLSKTGISTFPVITAPLPHSGEGNNGGRNPIKAT